MSEEPQPPPPANEPALVTRLGRTRPDIVMMAPFMAYLGFFSLGSVLPESWLTFVIALRMVGAFAVFWIFRRYFPPLGKAHWPIAIIAGIAAAVLWVQGQYLFMKVDIGPYSLGGRFFLYPGSIAPEDPSAGMSAFAWQMQATLKIACAVITVPIVEEIFWRGFMLRALISWDNFEKVPLGKFTWFSFLGTALLSTMQHPDNWCVSIFCWMFYNALMYWKKSLLMLMITHGVTNLVLYLWVLYAASGDPNAMAWIFW